MNKNISPNIVHKTIKTSLFKTANPNKLELNKDRTSTWSKTQNFDLLIDELEDFQIFCYRICQFALKAGDTVFLCSENIKHYTKIVILLTDIVKLTKEIKLTVQSSQLLKLEISETVRNKMSESLHIDLEQVVPTANFINDLGVDSLDWQQLLITLEDIFSIRISKEAARTLATVQQLIECVTLQVKKAKVVV